MTVLTRSAALADLNTIKSETSALAAQFAALNDEYKATYAFDFSEWDATVEQIDEMISGATALQEKFAAHAAAYSKTYDAAADLVVRIQSELAAFEDLLAKAEDADGAMVHVESGEFERDDLDVVINDLTNRRAEVAASGEKSMTTRANAKTQIGATKSATDDYDADALDDIALLEDIAAEILRLEADGVEPDLEMLQDSRDDAQAIHDRTNSEKLAETAALIVARLDAMIMVHSAANEKSMPTRANAKTQIGAANIETRGLVDVFFAMGNLAAIIAVPMVAYEAITGENPFDALDRLRQSVVDKWREFTESGDTDNADTAQELLDLIDEAESHIQIGDDGKTSGDDNMAKTSSGPMRPDHVRRSTGAFDLSTADSVAAALAESGVTEGLDLTDDESAMLAEHLAALDLGDAVSFADLERHIDEALDAMADAEAGAADAAGSEAAAA